MPVSTAAMSIFTGLRKCSAASRTSTTPSRSYCLARAPRATTYMRSLPTRTWIKDRSNACVMNSRTVREEHGWSTARNCRRPDRESRQRQGSLSSAPTLSEPGAPPHGVRCSTLWLPSNSRCRPETTHPGHGAICASQTATAVGMTPDPDRPVPGRVATAPDPATIVRGHCDTPRRLPSSMRRHNFRHHGRRVDTSSYISAPSENTNRKR
jgi:hypothetical protein